MKRLISQLGRWLSQRRHKERGCARTLLRCRPTVEALEQRLVPSSHSDCAVTVVDGVLEVIGTEEADKVLIVQHSAGVTVTCNGHPAQTFKDIDLIYVATLGGNDGVTMVTSDEPIMHLHRVFIVDAGEGSDFVQTSWLAPYHGTLDQRAFESYRKLIGQVTSDPGMGNYLNYIQGGLGGDHIAVNIGTPGARREAAKGHAALRIDGGDGQDAIDVALTNVDLPKNSQFSVDCHGDDGADRINFHMSQMTIVGRLDVSMGGYGGDDLIVVTIVSTPSNTFTGHASTDFRLIGHEGNDALLFLTDQYGGDVECEGGDGDDTIKFDVTHATSTPHTLRNMDVSLRGGRGNDVIEALFALNGQHGKLRADVLGEEGDDMLSLFLKGGDLLHTQAGIDGGEGSDLAQYSPGVKVRRVEKLG